MKIKTLIKRIQEIKLDKQKIILIAIATLFFAYLDFSFVIGMQSGGIKQINQKIIKAKNDIKTTKRELIRMQQIEGGGQAAVGLLKEFTSQDDIPMLLSEISNIAKKDGIKITQIEPSKNLQGSPAEKIPENMSRFAIDLEVKGGYHDLGAFLGDLEAFTKYISVDEIRIVPQGDDYNKQRISLRLITYVSG